MNPMEMFKREESNCSSRMAYDNSDSPKCPHCGEIYNIQENEAWELYSEDPEPIKCPSCDIEFGVKVNVSYSYSTSEQDEEVWDWQGVPDNQAR